MAKIEGNCRDVCEATEFVTIVTTGDDGPHVVGNWGDYMRALGVGADTIVLPAGRYRQTEQNLRKNNRVQLLVASRKVQGTRSPGQGYLIVGTAEIVSSGEIADAVKAKFPWTRGALVIYVEEVTAQL
jgi:predicted pyridoxine 5'-phosphate oxidase superfamily flavin-nucleotide-binding protein